MRLLRRYGGAELQSAIMAALDRDVPHPNAVRLALERRREDRQQVPPVAMTLPAHVHRHADPLFELISRRYEQKSTVVTTNRPFAEWRDVFPNAACVVSMVDRLMHNAEIVAIDGESYRVKEARERAELRAKQRRGGK